MNPSLEPCPWEQDLADEHPKGLLVPALCQLVSLSLPHPNPGFVGLSHVDLNVSLTWPEVTGMGVGFAFFLMGSISSNMQPIGVANKAGLPTLSGDLHSLGNAVSKSTPCRKS